MPEAMPDRMPEDMPEDTPDRMPDRMPEDMSDRMPEDLPVSKCINVTVGIARSKVFFFTTNLFIVIYDILKGYALCRRSLDTGKE